MLNSKTTRTTITLPEDLFFELKKKALLERKKIKDIVVESLSLVLKYHITSSNKDGILSYYGAWGKGEKGSEFLKKNRNSKTDQARNSYLKNLWKKS